jgi:hypothetical protein
MAWFVEKAEDSTIAIVGGKTEPEKGGLLATYAKGEGFQLYFPVDDEDEAYLKAITRILRKKRIKPFTFKALRKLPWQYRDQIEDSIEGLG